MPHLDVPRGAKIALIGESGSGKSTLLEILAMLLRPTTAGHFEFRPLHGEPAVDVDRAWASRDADTLSALRSRHIGYVLQHGGLLPYLTVRQNIELSRRLLGLGLGDAARRFAARLGIEPQLDKRPGALSVGQRQRAAIARALAHEPPIVIADEPTASVDPINATMITELLAQLTDELDVTLIVASHAQDLMRRTGFVLLPHDVEASSEQSMRVRVETPPQFQVVSGDAAPA